MRGNSDAPEGIGDPGKLIPQNERELPLFFFCLFFCLTRKFPPNLGQVKFTVVTGELERNERACLSLWPAPLSHPSRRRGRGMSRETSLLSPSLTLRPRWARTPGCSELRPGLYRTLSRSFSRSVWYALVCNEATVWPAAAYTLPFKRDSGA